MAQRSATAAQEIKTLIDTSGAKVADGVHLVREAGSAMDNVVASFQQLADLVAEIANSSREQTQEIGAVTQAVGQMDQATQQNAALVEEAAATAENLEEQARSLVRSVARFRLSHD